MKPMMKVCCMALLFAVLASAAPARADVLWDTGPGSGNGWGYPGIYPFGYTLLGGAYNQYAAGRLDLTQTTTLTKVQGWMATDGSYYDGAGWVGMDLSGGDLTIAIYATDMDAWLPGALVYRSAVFSLVDGSQPDWYGISFNTVLDAGYYFISFEPVDDTFSGVMSSSHWMSHLGLPFYYPSNPMPQYAFNYAGEWSGYGGWYDAVGMRIEGFTGGQVATPEPSTLVLAALGLAGALVMRRRLSR